MLIASRRVSGSPISIVSPLSTPFHSPLHSPFLAEWARQYERAVRGLLDRATPDDQNLVLAPPTGAVYGG